MIPTRAHAALDGLSALALLAAPGVFGWRAGYAGPVRALGAGVAAYSLATAYEEGERGLIGMREHLAVDALQGLASCAAAAAMRDAPRDLRLFLAGYGLFSLAAAALTERAPARAAAPQIPLTREALADVTRGERAREVAPGIAYRRLGIVNVVFLGEAGAGDRGWVLVDAGLVGTAEFIEAAAKERFGEGARPAAIVLTHGHFDHVGALAGLAERWDAPVYAHTLEHPYLDGRSSYPPGDPTVGGGLMAALGPLFPTAPKNVGDRLRALPEDGAVPGAAGWRWLHTPGHSPGHVSLWRERDRALVAGDAVITTRQESAYAVAVQTPEMHGPPSYFTIDWGQAKASVEKIARLAPEIVVAGHGAPMKGPAMRAALERLAREFDAIAVPQGSRYARTPQTAGEGAYR